jgi:hypothetical protein
VVVVVLDLRRSHCGLSVSGAVPFGTVLSQKSIPGTPGSRPSRIAAIGSFL